MSFGFYNENYKLNTNKNKLENNFLLNEDMNFNNIINNNINDDTNSLTIIKPTHFKKLKSSLKLSSRNNSLTSSISSSSSSSSSSNKSVRFAPELTTVKKFCSTDKPSFISSSLSIKNSNNLIPLDESYQNYFLNENNNKNNNKFEFDDKINSHFLPSFSLPSLPSSSSLYYNSNSKVSNLTNFQLDYDSDSSVDDDDFTYNLNQNIDIINNNTNTNIVDDNDNQNHNLLSSITSNDKLALDSFEVIDWNLIHSNLNSNNYDNNNDINILLTGNQNIKLHSIEQIRDSNNKKTDEIIGSIYVNNLTFEKFIEIKFTFTNWSDIHYVTATFNKSITKQIDEFKFKINLSSFKYFLKLDHLLFSTTDSNLPTNCPLKIEFCCRYDVNNETYYDNNNYKNYELSILAKTQNLVPNERFNPIYMTKEQINHKDNLKNSKKINNNSYSSTKQTKKSFYSDFLVSTTLSHKIHLMNNFKTNNNNGQAYKKRFVNSTISRRFSEDTDYYNTSPLKHLYHNDTTPINPTSLNRVLAPSNEKEIDGNGNDYENNNDNAEDATIITGNNISYPSTNPYECTDDVAQLSSFQPFTYTATPSLSSSLSSSLSDLPQLDDYTYFFQNETTPDEQFQYNPNYNFADSFTKSFSQAKSESSDGTDVPNNFKNIINNKNNNSDDNDEHIDPLHITDSNNNFSDDRRSIITDTPQNIYSTNSVYNVNERTTSPEIMFMNNNSNETLINHKNNINGHHDNDTQLALPQISTLRSETVDEPSPTSSRSSSNSSSFLSASNELENRRCSNMSSQIANTITTSALSGITESIEPRALNYQTLLNSYCFFASDTKPTIHESYFQNKKTVDKDNPVDKRINYGSITPLNRSESPPPASKILSS
ncbi:similar to Saccharomyces cerevisiae YOR178C GAC1 Regulatory subunit for Glc7p type-1 protein phosphatase (PP1) [Maudiozyma saulgeensis]|uniref:Similar to Saccharomyces cerevisiae YOR178C GAC1 Regulatory subunit for Glc7p type-1 protein phosphatase (PP1) n=1 Tax=Maudiozyma saulgeensis TaxID=1789683 RepID=A0A1X7R730_9SACH|nr:similar to Saccharomyces cerevisiae YOR178C GAC1 Regulatory subunit for Glc7p type-1 protein phosphatase (PP1) [Kazachstania saulgeensis]